MTLDEYKQACNEVLTGLPLELCAGQDIFTPGDWPEADRLRLLRLYTLHTIAADVPYEESEQYFDFWWSLPVREDLKQAVLMNMRAV
ncbi:MAG: hypothetical protein L0226_14720 [Acidobacteria bacterium]|nr:hypothetical protein [Acidobacteriota bacterium]